jgi:hypothetical protein
VNDEENEPVPGCDWKRYDCVADLILDQRRMNDKRAAQVARTIVGRLRADGVPLAPGLEEGITLRVLKLLNEQLERESAGIERHMAESLTPMPQQLLH